VRVRYAIGGMLAAVLLALPASATAAGGGKVTGIAAQQCAQERSQLGKKAFRKKYGAKHTMRTCAKRTRPQVAAAVGTASDDCAAELAGDGATDFIDLYGEDETDTLGNAMDECVAESVDEILHPEDYVDGEETDDE
jgi:hypothetical protein